MLTLRAYLAVAAVLALLLLLGWTGCVRGEADRAKAGREGARDDAAARRLEVEGRDRAQAKQGELTDALLEGRRTTDALDREARQDPDAQGALPPSVRDRSRRADGELCDTGPCR